ncbi:MAG: VOC family protein [Acidobacteriota bacterium]|nr:VOC family protein [Acidobacteriota bacterium]
MAVKAIPEGLRTVTPAITVRDGKKALEFYKQAFGAEVKGVHLAPDGKVAHAEILIGDSVVMLSDEFPPMATSPQTIGGTATGLIIYAENIDQLWDRAIKAGGTVTMPLADQFWGDRWGALTDPFGHRWSFAQHIEDVAPEELARRSKEAFAKMAAAAKTN